MNDLNEIKDELLSLVYSGRKEEAIQRLKQKYGATNEEAEQLLQLALKESFSPADFFKRAAKAGSANFLGNGAGCVKSIFSLIAYGFGFFGIPMLLAAAGIFIYQHYFISNSTRIIGTAVEIEEYYGDGSLQYLPVITYEVNSKTYSTKATVSSNTQQYYVNDPVPLFVNTQDPTDVLIDSFMERWFVITLLGSLGFLFTFIMVAFIRKSKKK